MQQKNIEVELRGPLSGNDIERLETFFKKHGALVETQDREMYLLRGYPGYSTDFVGRDTDIRLRNTNGKCEIMLKQKVGDAREEISLRLADDSLDAAKRIVKALGCTTARWMHRTKKVYLWKGIEWSLVKAPPSAVLYFEAEISVFGEQEIDAAKEVITDAAKELHLSIYSDDETRALIERLNREANKEVEL